MKISRLIIKNYRNLKDVDIYLGETVVLIGENNSGKSNLLRALTLPFLTDESTHQFLPESNFLQGFINPEIPRKTRKYEVMQ